LIPARAGLNAVADPRGRNIQAGTAIFKFIVFRGSKFMLRNFTFVLICFSLAANLACSTADAPTANANTANVVNLDPANLPPGFSTSPIPIGTNSIPGIPDPNDANANKISPGNIPGIPDPSKKTPQPKKTPPIPGIPDEATIKKQMNTPLSDVNIVNNPPPSQSNANNRPPDKRGNTRQP